MEYIAIILQYNLQKLLGYIDVFFYKLPPIDNDNVI